MDTYISMKLRHGSDIIILFHVGDFYEAYIEDSRIVAEILSLPRKVLEIHSEYIVYVTRLRADNLKQHLNKLYDAGYSVCVSGVRGPGGTHILKIVE
ncbi:hypothetical protein [Bacteroides uniformis]|uniref:hypothetical protein n=1 Tax=Bacteroides uniformis TaxID=820 RepID=UPI00233ECEED|nr:hypothetical protein [Bacteroides uniformis]